MIIGIMSAFGSGVAYNFIRKLKDTEHPLVVILYFQIVGLVVSIPALFFVWKTPAGIQWLYLLLVGIFSQLGQVFLTNAFSRERAASVAIVVYSGLIYAISVGWIIYGEEQRLFTFIGMLLVVGGLAASVVYSKRQRSLDARIDATVG